MTGTLHTTSRYLCGVSAHLPPDRLGSEGRAVFRLYEADQAEPLREVTVSRPTAVGRWCVFPFAAIPDSDDKTFTFTIDGDSDFVKPLYGAPLGNVFDPWLSQRGQLLPPIPHYLRDYLNRHVLECIRMKRHFFLRLAHLADAVGRIAEPIERVLSIGAGVGYQEAFVAGRFPDTHVLATDLELTDVTFPMPNLQFGRLDVLDEPESDQYDLVFSIECLEHVEDDRRAFRHLAARVRPGRYLYLSVPFASRAEQQNPELRRSALEEWGHYRPGFAFEDLETLFEENGLDVVHASNMFHTDVIVPVRQIVDRLSETELECAADAVASLFLRDIRGSRVESFRQAEGVRILGRRRT